jgi:hypothetical protein
MKVIVAGTRHFSDYNLLHEKLDHLLQNVTEEIYIISGKAAGADRLGEIYAKAKGYNIIECPAKWTDFTVKPCAIRYRRDGTPYNALAGHNRNEEMAKIADACVCFWDGRSTGTKNMIDLAQKYKLKLRVIRY